MAKSGDRARNFVGGRPAQVADADRLQRAVKELWRWRAQQRIVAGRHTVIQANVGADQSGGGLNLMRKALRS